MVMAQDWFILHSIKEQADFIHREGFATAEAVNLQGMNISEVI
jgi:hypothetical protein